VIVMTKKTSSNLSAFIFRVTLAPSLQFVYPKEEQLQKKLQYGHDEVYLKALVLANAIYTCGLAVLQNHVEEIETDIVDGSLVSIKCNFKL